LGLSRKKTKFERLSARGLRAKIIGWFLVPIAVILTAVAVLVFVASQRVTQELAYERNQSRTQLLASQLAVELTTYGQTLRALTSGASQPEAYSPAAAVTRLLESAWPVGPLEVFDGGVLFVDVEGVIIATTRGLNAHVGQRVTLTTSTPESLGYGDIQVSALGGTDLIFLAQPLPAPALDSVAGRMVGLSVFFARSEPRRDPAPSTGASGSFILGDASRLPRRRRPIWSMATGA
jgi:hypothetical protein